MSAHNAEVRKGDDWARLKARAVDLLNQGIEPPAIAERLGCSARAVREWRQELRQHLANDAARCGRPA